LALSLPLAAGIVGFMNRRGETTVFALVPARLALVAALVLGAALRVCGSGLSGEYLTDVWTADNGLPDSSITAIAQTPDGYLWVGTYNGLARFDGMRFVTFDPANTPALAHARVRTLSVDDQGTLWINTFDGSMTSLRKGTFAREWTGEEGLDPDVTLVSSRSNQVTFLLHKGNLRRKPLSAPVGTGWEDFIPTNRSVGTTCVEDGGGMIWYRGSDKFLWQVTASGFGLQPQTNGLAGSRVNCMTTDPQGRLWAATDQGIEMWDGVRFQTITPTNAELPADVEFLSVARDGRLWADADGHVREAIGRRWILEAESLKNVFTGNLSRMGAQADHRGGVWLYDYGRGLTHVAADGQVLKFGPPEGFPGDRVNCFFEDHEGNWWAGLDAEGLVRIRERRFQTIDIGGQVSTKPARSVCEQTDGTVWIGTLGDGLARWRAGASTTLTMPGGTGGGFAFSVCPDAAGRLWVSAGDEDLFVSETNGFKRVLPVVHGVKTILADKAGRIWVGAKNGLYVADGGSTNIFRQNQGVGRIGVRALAEDGHGDLWAGAEDGALFRITAGNTNYTVTAFHPDDNKVPHTIWSLLAEEDGTVWAGTFSGGLLRFRDGKFTRFGINEGLPDSIICQILPDGAGNLWIGSHQGIFRVAKSALNDFARGAIRSIPCMVYGRTDGLPSLECSGGYQPAAWRGQDGRLWFTTIKGAVSVMPDEIHPNLLPPPVVIEEILIDGKGLDDTTKAPAQPVPAGIVYNRDRKFLEVPPGKHQFEFRYTGLSMVSSDRVQFRYRLEGADEDWVDAGTRRFAQYNLLPAGTYRFNVIACNSDGVWNESGGVLTLKILPHFYETLWFRVLAGLVAAGLVAGAVRYSVMRRLHRKMEQLAHQQAVERERARIAKDIHDDLGANLTLIAVLGDLAKQEKTVERIEKMAATARQAVKSLDEIVWAVNPRNDTLAHLIDYTGQFAVDYLRAAGVRCLLDVPEQAPPREVPTNVRHNVFLVVKEALQNIVKHARATEVWLRINATSQGLRIVIEDNGGGFKRVPEDALADGLRNMRQRMAELGGECRIQSRVGVGTEIVAELPWPPG
jgi:signal transduction histidine kinase/ligand-binding sensor domain-containing protein